MRCTPPVDDGAADHLVLSRLPALALPATDGRSVRLDREGTPWLIVYAYPKTGRPGEPELTPDWDQIPGARGCTPESCGFRDHHAELLELGAEVFARPAWDAAYSPTLGNSLSGEAKLELLSHSLEQQVRQKGPESARDGPLPGKASMSIAKVVPRTSPMPSVLSPCLRSIVREISYSSGGA